ncbi:hypothetical protein [Nostoc sp.]
METESAVVIFPVVLISLEIILKGIPFAVPCVVKIASEAGVKLKLLAEVFTPTINEVAIALTWHEYFQ